MVVAGRGCQNNPCYNLERPFENPIVKGGTNTDDDISLVQ
jgi:hypothetical protein